MVVGCGRPTKSPGVNGPSPAVSAGRHAEALVARVGVHDDRVRLGAVPSRERGHAAVAVVLLGAHLGRPRREQLVEMERRVLERVAVVPRRAARQHAVGRRPRAVLGVAREARVLAVGERAVQALVLVVEPAGLTPVRALDDVGRDAVGGPLRVQRRNDLGRRRRHGRHDRRRRRDEGHDHDAHRSAQSLHAADPMERGGAASGWSARQRAGPIARAQEAPTASAPDEDGLERVMRVIGSHLERFGRRDELSVTWEVSTPAS